MNVFPNNQLENVQKNRNHLIDLLRFLAASGVILFHLNEPYPYINNFYRNFCKLGFLGVPIFFVISGYCIKIAENHARSPGKFITRRLFRIFPPYWFSVVLVVVIAVSIKLITGTNSTPLPKDISGISASIFLYTTPLSDFKTINWVYWTLPYEIAFYLIICLIMFFSKKLKALLLFTFTGIALLIPFQNNNILFFCNELPTFMLGYSLYLIINKTENLYLSVILFTICLFGIYNKHSGFEYPIISICVCISIFINHIVPLKNNFFSGLGDYSYSMYLIHVPIGIYLLGFIKEIKIVQTNILFNITNDLCVLILIIFISRFTFKWIELRYIEMGRKLSGSNNK